MAGPPSKRLCVHLLTSCSVPGVGGVLFVADAGFALLNVYTPKHFIAVTTNQKIRNKHLHKKCTSPLQSSSHSSVNVSPPTQNAPAPRNPKPGFWKAILGVSKWVLETIKQDYSLQFTRRIILTTGMFWPSQSMSSRRVHCRPTNVYPSLVQFSIQHR